MSTLLFEKFSDWYRLKKAVAWMLRLKKTLQARIRKWQLPHGPLSVDELLTAEKEIVRHVQKTNLEDSTLKSSSLQRLSPFTSSDGLKCVGGRPSETSLKSEAKHPWILPSKHHQASI